MEGEPRRDPDARPWWRRALRVIGLAFFWPILTVFVLLASIILHLDSAPARRELCDRVEPLMNDALAGSFSMECIEISPNYIQVDNFEARSPDGTLVLRIASAQVNISRNSLFFGRLVVESVLVKEPFVDLSTDAQGEMRIANAFIPVDPTPPDPNAKKTNIPRVVIQELRLTGGRVVNLSPELDVQGIELHADGVVDDQVEAKIHSLVAEVVNTEMDQVVARIARFDADAELLTEDSITKANLRVDGMNGDFVEGDVTMVWGPEIPEDFAGTLRLQVSPETLVAAGIPQIETILESPVSGTVTADIDFSGKNVIDADLTTDGGPLLVHAELSEQWERIDVHVESESIDLAQVLVPIERGRFEGEIDAELHPPGDDGRRRVVLDGQDLSLLAPDGNTYGAPAIHAAAFLGEDHVELLELDLPHLEGDTGHLDVTGRIGFDGAVDVVVDADIPNIGTDPNLEQLVGQPVSGALVVDARVKLDPNRNFEVDASGSVVGRHLNLPGIRADYLEVRGDVSGSAPAPEADILVSTRGLRAGTANIHDADLHIVGGSPNGGPGEYRIRGDVDAELPQARADADIDLVATVDRNHYGLDGRAEVRGVWPTPITLDLDGVEYDPAVGLSARNVQVRTVDGMGVKLSGLLDLQGQSSDARVSLHDVELAQIASRFGIGFPLHGKVYTDIAFRGSIESPVLDTTGRVDGLRIGDVVFEEARWDVDVSRAGSGSSEVAVKLAVESSANGRAELDARGRVPARNPLRALPQAYWDATFTASDLRLALVHEIAPDAPELSGFVDAKVTLDGSVEQPERLAIEIDARETGIPGMAQLGAHIETVLEGDDLALAVRVLHPSDETLFVLEANATSVHPMQMATSSAPLSFLSDPWVIEFHIPERALSQFPEPLNFSAPMTASLRGRIAGGGATLSQGGRSSVDVLASGLAPVRDLLTGTGLIDTVQGKPQVGRGDFSRILEATSGYVEGWARYDADAEGCAAGNPEMRLQARLHDGRTEVRVTGEIAGRENLIVTAEAETPVARWVITPPTEIPEVRVDVEASHLPLHDVPILCNYVSGEMDMRLEGREIFGESPTVALEAVTDDLSVSGSEPLKLRLSAGANRRKATVDLSMTAADRVAFRVNGSAPLAWGDGALYPTLAEGERFEGEAEFDRMPVQPLLAAVPMISDSKGILDGEVRAWGTSAQDVHVRGAIAMKDIGFVLRQPYMRVENLEGRISLDDEGVHARQVRFTDRDGWVRVSGDLQLDGWTPRHAQVEVRSDDFPLRVEGVIYAYLDTQTQMTAELGEDLNSITINMRRTAIRLPEDIGRSIQPLAQHTDVIYEDQPGFDRNDSVAVVDDAATRQAVPTLIRVRSEPFWVRRDDFSLQVRPRLDIHLEPEEPVRIAGPVEIRRGFIAFLGKEFELLPGEVRFTGGNKIDPRVDIRAEHELRRGGEVITAHITGNLFRPELDFTSSTDPSLSDSEAIQILVRGRPGSSSGDAANEATSFLTGMFAGVLSSVTRREFGEYVPVIGLESEGGVTSLRVGFQADQLIPEALDDVILGAYVEGYVGGGSGTGSGSGGAFAGGATIEFILPRSLVWSSTYDVPTNWSTDLMWEP